MDLIVPFIFRTKPYTCLAYIDCLAEPCFIFTILLDNELIQEFGDDVTIKTDMQICLPRKDDFAELKALRQAIFNYVALTTDFQEAKNTILRSSRVRVAS